MSQERLFGTSSSTEAQRFNSERIHLNKIFNNERDYIFSTDRNVRSFEWTAKEAEDLFDSILETLAETEGGLGDTLELNTVTLLKKDLSFDEQKQIGKTAAVYDVGTSHMLYRILSQFLPTN